MKKILTIVLSIICVACFSLFIVGCNKENDNDNANNEIYSIYTTYVAYAEENGQTPLSYEEWLANVKGEKGETGANGIDGVSPKLQINATTNMWEVSYDNGKTWNSLNVKATGSDGTNGTNGTNGVDGVSPKLQINTTTNMWEVSYDDGKTWTSLNVKATGSDGTNGVDGVSPKLQINTTTNMWEISYDNGKTWTSLNVKATGSNGTNGVNGLSAYELFKKYNPTYNKTENEWLEDLVAGQLHVINITIDGDGGNVDDTNIITKSNSYISVDIPTKNGYDFVGWSLNGSIIDINTYVFFTDCTLKAIWKDAEEVTINFNADSGIVSPVKTIIEFGKNYSLPTPSKEYQTFAGWYYLDTLIPQTGIWEYTHEDITLTAKWNKTNIYANLSVDAEYGTVDKTRTTLAIGDYYTLPIPSSLKAGESFQGWYNGNEKVTDAQGKSFEKCSWDSTVTLTAAYYIEISTIYEFMDLAGKDLVGKYIITQDLDFKGLAINSINSLSGTFDGGGHTLKNLILSTTANESTYSGLFHEITKTAIIENIKFENCTTNNRYSSLLVGKVKVDLLYDQPLSIKNIQFLDSFNNIDARSILIGSIVSLRYSSKVAEIDNIFCYDSGNQVYTFGIYSICGHVDSSTSNYKTYYTLYYPGANFYNIHIEGKDNMNQDACALIYGGKEKDADTNGMIFDKEYKGEFIIENYYLNQNIAFGVAKNGSQYESICQVEKATILAKTKVAFSGVKQLSDSINIGLSEKWGAVQSTRCVDAGENAGIYNYSADYGEEQIYSSIVLYPNANNEYFYYTSSGEEQTFVDSTLITKDFFISLLCFDETVWNLDNIDVENGIYPTIRK